MFDINDVQKSYEYVIVTDQIDVPGTGQFIEVPQEFVDNFIMGLLDFSAAQHASVLDFNWEFFDNAGTYGVQVAASVPESDLIQSALTRQGVTLFYIKTWICPDTYVFDEGSNLCVLCSIANCITCGDTSTCILCD